jgi:hypothetical protein
MAATIETCTARFVVVYLYLRAEDAPIGHANYVIIDKHDNVVERYDPHGGRAYDTTDYKHDLLDHAIQQYFTNLYNDLGWPVPRFRAPFHSCYRGVQLIENNEKMKGLCSVWAAWYVAARLQYPELGGRQITDMVNKASDADRRSLYRQLVHFVVWALYNIPEVQRRARLHAHEADTYNDAPDIS